VGDEVTQQKVWLEVFLFKCRFGGLLAGFLLDFLRIFCGFWSVLVDFGWFWTFLSGS